MVELPPIPGIAVRFAEPRDLKLIFSSWFESGLKPFVAGVGNFPPLPSHLSLTVDDARRRGNVKLLHAIYHAEMEPFIVRTLHTVPILVAYDSEDPQEIFGWAHAGFAYTKRLWRGQGIARALWKALGEENSR